MRNTGIYENPLPPIYPQIFHGSGYRSLLHYHYAWCPKRQLFCFDFIIIFLQILYTMHLRYNKQRHLRYKHVVLAYVTTLLTWTHPSSVLWRTWHLFFISLTSYTVESAHWPFWIGRMKLFENSFNVPKRFGLTKLTIQWSETVILEKLTNKPAKLNTYEAGSQRHFLSEEI